MGMGYWDYCWGLYRDYYRDALLSTRQSIGLLVVGASPLAVSGSIN